MDSSSYNMLDASRQSYAKGMDASMPSESTTLGDFRSSKRESARASTNDSTAPAQARLCAFGNVGYNKGLGKLRLTKQGLIYRAYDDSTTNEKLKVRWTTMSAPPKSNSQQLKLKIYLDQDKYCVFQLQDQAELEQAKAEITKYLWASALSEQGQEEESNPHAREHIGANERTRDQEDPSIHQDPAPQDLQRPSLQPKSNSGGTSYPNASYAGHEGGRILLTESALFFFGSESSTALQLPWPSISKVKVNAPSQPQALLRVVSDHRNHVFGLKDRLVLDRLKKDVKGKHLAALVAQKPPPPPPRRLSTTEPSTERSFESAGPRQKTSALRQSHGANKRHHDSVKPTLGSFGRIVGPVADIKELEYISCLHQNVEPLLRSDGTISSQDIIPYLQSRYGVTITTEQAVDIACNLCGAKPRNELSAERDARQNELHNPAGHSMRSIVSEVVKKEDQQDKDDEDDEEEVYYFDLVQVMSLLLIPELLQLSDQKETPNSVVDMNAPVSFLGEEDENGSLRLSDKAGGVVQVVIHSLMDIFEEDIRNDLRRGVPLTANNLQTMLEAFGDDDSANNPEIVQQMLDALGTEPVLSTETLLRALTSDAQAYPRTSDNPLEETKATESTKRSVFFDCWGFNWDNDTRDKENKDVTPKTFGTASFIDYAADTYRSVLHNTAVWCLFILTTLIYLNFFQQMIKDATGNVCHEENFGCSVGNKIVAWIITAIFCGFYGLFFIIPTSFGNVYGQKKSLLLTFLVSAVFIYAPFSTLILYERGVPHNVKVINEYQIICPGWIDPGEAQTDFNTKGVDTTQFFLYMDDSCLTAVEWCEAHPEVQGKYLDETPDFLTYKEFGKCYDFLAEQVLGPDPLPFWTGTGRPCDPANITASCPGDHPCAKQGLHDQNFICCHGSSSYYETAGNTYIEVCDMQPPGAPCTNAEMCESQACANDLCLSNSTDESSAGNTELGTSCESNVACKSGFCNPQSRVCEPMPSMCPEEEFEILGGFRLDPFCRTIGDWCNINDPNQLLWNMIEWGFAPEKDESGDDDGGDDDGETCQTALMVFLELQKQYLEVPLLIMIDPSDADVGYTYEEVSYNAVENVLVDPWTYFVLICIAIVGSFALLAMVRGLVSPHSDDRPKDHRIKCAASYKIANVIENALSMHNVQGSNQGTVMRNFFLNGEQVVEVGGLMWTLKGVWSGSLFSEEGLRYTGRLWIGLVTMVVVAIIGVASAIEIVDQLASEVDEIRKELNDYYTQEQVEQISNREWPTFTQDDLTVSKQEQTLLDQMPEAWMIEASGFPAVIVATLVAAFCILLYVPSYTNTVLKLRSGMIPSLHDPFFGGYRKMPDNVVPNIGNMVFSMMGAAVFSGAIVFGIIFLFAWQQTRGIVLGYVAVAIGIVCTMIIKMVGQGLLRGRNFSSFYRKQPGSANYANLFFECWYLGTSLLVVVSRLISFLITSALWLGRVDTEFLHPNVKVFGKNLDKLPEAFRRDMLAHEAHSHPFIERLGGMYLLRLRDGDNFGNVAGTNWRCMFACGLMPWICKYKVNTNSE